MTGQGRTVAAGLLPDPSTQAKLSQHFEPRLHLLHKIVDNVGGGSENRPLLSGSCASDRILNAVDHRTRQPLQRPPFHAQFRRKRLKRIDADGIDITYASDRDRHGKKLGAVCGSIMIVATIVGLALLFAPALIAPDPSAFEPEGTSAMWFWVAWPAGALLCGIVTLLWEAFGKGE